VELPSDHSHGEANRMNSHRSARITTFGRGLLVRRVREEGWRPAAAAEAAGVSTRTAYKWLARFDELGAPGLENASSRPLRFPNQVPSTWQELVLELRREHRMTAEQIAARLRIPRSTVARIVSRAGAGRLKYLDPPPNFTRYERATAGELLHLDVKKLGRIKGIGKRVTGLHSGVHRARGIGWEFVHVCVDDYTRLAYVEVLEDEKGPTTVGFLRRAVAWFADRGVQVRGVMTDNGANYRSNVFRAAMAQLRLKHVRTKPYTPRTNGKAERFIQTMLREWAYARPYVTSARRRTSLAPWVRRYNERRPHGGIGGTPPITRLLEAAA
jgi:transposase InsO family protein